MPDKKILILDKNQIQQKLNRISYQIWEDNIDEEDIVIAGIAEHGYTIAKRLKAILEEISGIKISLMRIELDKGSTHLQATTDIPMEQCLGKVVILVDDVLNSGKTLAYGLGVFLDVPLKKIRTAVLVDRSHRAFPVSPDFMGLQIATVLKEHVEVILNEETQEEAVYLS
jgi:pyrimidine operon attenuation protein / uracil phosphoribosyltransferase